MRPAAHVVRGCAVRNAFVSHFGLSKSDVPLLRLRGTIDGYRRGFHIEGDAPFSLAPCEQLTERRRENCERLLG